MSGFNFVISATISVINHNNFFTKMQQKHFESGRETPYSQGALEVIR
jgi:hypothetical protein